MRRAFVLLVLGGACSTPSADPTPAGSAAPSVERAVADPIAEAWSALAEGDERAALSAAQRAVGASPESAAAHEALGRARLASDEAGPAAVALARALELDPTRRDARFALARAKERAGDLEGARDAYAACAEAGVRPARAISAVARLAIDRLPSRPDEERLEEIERTLDRADAMAGADTAASRAIVALRRRIEAKRDGRGGGARGESALGRVVHGHPSPRATSPAATGPLVRLLSAQARYMDPDIARRVGRVRIPALRACYEAALVRAPELDGVLHLVVTIDPRGTVRDATVESSGCGASVDACVASAARGWTFPATGGVAIADFGYALTNAR
ncbi:MAG: AgmX/PglI C-terminal domain-containing protein [Sandaracinaceae bacterium]